MHHSTRHKTEDGGDDDDDVDTFTETVVTALGCICIPGTIYPGGVARFFFAVVGGTFYLVWSGLVWSDLVVVAV